MALLLFMLLPLQLLILTSSIQFEAATFFVLAATLAFFSLVGKPNFTRAVLLTLGTAACLYADDYAGLPVLGAVLFLLRFSPGPQERKALWFSLASCAGGAALYAPYYMWASGHKSSHWLTEPPLSLSSFGAFTMLDWIFAATIPLILAGVLIAAFASFRFPHSRFTRPVNWLCLFGSVLLTLAVILGTGLYRGFQIAPRDLIYAAPATIILFVAGAYWLMRDLRGVLRHFATAVSLMVLLAFGWADCEFVTAPKQDLALESRYVGPELTSNSCVVFVSEYFSRPLFFIFQPQLESHECREFFNSRIVLASHPYVRPDEQANAEGAFVGLGFKVVKRIRSGGGQIVVFEGK
jgi:hypothetical protein